MATLANLRGRRQRNSALPRIVKVPALRRFRWLVHGFSTRRGGTSEAYGGKSLNLSFTKNDSRENVERNRKLFLSAAGAGTKTKPWPLITLRQIHSDLIHVVRSATPGPLAGDGMVTNLPGVALGILTADCFPVLLVDAKNKAVGAFHCGWRPTVKRMVEKGLGVMRYEYGTRPEDVHAAIGPAIQSCCYEVGDELKEQFESQFAYGSELFHSVQESDPVREKYPLLFMNMRAPGHGDLCIKLHLDLREANRRQLLAMGVPEKNIVALRHCTACDTRNFFSHRAENGHTGRMLAVVGMKS
ncbi:MAG TPA: peptidoglycan editing factor PgeF [Candidatus Angelobacter sp.]|nr:peptidoglycan editing factor PgeF [Candidatus Angelobacter sp.]